MRTFTVEFPDEPAPTSVVLTERGVAYQRHRMVLGGSQWWPAEEPGEDGARVLMWRELCTTGTLRLVYEPTSVPAADGPSTLGGGDDDGP